MPATPQAPNPNECEQKGADISVAARIYLADVADHVLILTEEVDMLRGTVENMINLVISVYALLTVRYSTWSRPLKTSR